MKTDTPRTDEALQRSGGLLDMVNFARELEHENARLRARGDHWQTVADTAEHENARLRENLEFTALAEALVKSGLIEQNALEDPEWYDGGITCEKIKKARDILVNDQGQLRREEKA